MKNLRVKPRLDKISQTSSPEMIFKQVSSPLRPNRNRIMIGGMGDSYLSFFKIQNQVDTNNTKISGQLKKNQNPKQTLAQKDQIIQDLQQKIMKQTVKKNARQKCFQERITNDWKKHIEYFIVRMATICVQLCKNNKEHKRYLLKILHQSCSHKIEGKKLILVLISWILQWLQPILKMFHETIRRKYCI